MIYFLWNSSPLLRRDAHRTFYTKIIIYSRILAKLECSIIPYTHKMKRGRLLMHRCLKLLTKARVVEGLAKLMCTQEFVRRRNANSAESVREKVLRYPRYPTLLIRAKRAREEKEDSIQDQDQSDSEQSEFARPPSSPASSIGSFHEHQDAKLVPIPIPCTQANINNLFQYSLARRASPGKHRNPPRFHLSA